MINLKQELNNLNIETLCARCKSCLNELKCLKQPNGKLKFFCPVHHIMENEYAYLYELKSTNGNIETVRKPNYDVKTKSKPISFCFSYKTNGSCRLHNSCLFPHSISEQNVWELLRRLKFTMDEFILEILKSNNLVESYNQHLKVYSLSSDLHYLIKTKNLKKLKQFLSFFDADILLTENSQNQTILHSSCKAMSKKMIKFLLDYEQLAECFGGPSNLNSNTFKNFINHKDKNGETALSLLLENNINTEKLNQLAMIFFNTEEYNLKQFIGSHDQLTTIMHRLIEGKHLKLIQYLCFNQGDRIDLSKLKNSSNLSSKSLACLNSLNTNDKENRKICDTINACIISKTIRNYITLGLSLNDELVKEKDLDSIEFGFKKFKIII